MRKIVLALAAAGVMGFALPAAMVESAQAERRDVWRSRGPARRDGAQELRRAEYATATQARGGALTLNFP